MANNDNKKIIQNLKILHLNAQGIRHKFKEIKTLVEKYRPSILLFNECKIDMENNQYNIKGYDKITHTLEKHLTTAMYVQRGAKVGRNRSYPRLA